MIIKKTVMTSLLILSLSLIWQGTFLYGMLSRSVVPVVQKYTKPLSRELSNFMTRRSYCGSGKETDPIKNIIKKMDNMQKDLASIKESVDWINLPKKWYESFPVKALSTSLVIFSIPGAFLGYDYGRNIMVRYFIGKDVGNALNRYFSKQSSNNVDDLITDQNQDSDNAGQ